MQKSNCFLSSTDYTFFNALAWGNCACHYRRAAAEGPLFQRVFHGAISAIELIPLAGQVISLGEMGVACLGRRVIVPLEESPLGSKRIALVPPALSDEMTLVLPQDKTEFEKSFSPLHRRIDLGYQDLPWPSQVQKVIVLTEVCDNLGDIVAAGKCIDLLQQAHPMLMIDWVFFGISLKDFNPKSFLECKDPSKISVREWESVPYDPSPTDLVITGPVRLKWSCEHISALVSREIHGPLVSFAEITAPCETFSMEKSRNLFFQKELQKKEGGLYKNLHSFLFPSQASWNPFIIQAMNVIPMGLEPFRGVFLDANRLEAPLSRGYYCPSYLFQIQDKRLRSDILESMGVSSFNSKVDCDRHSFNFGYAHHISSWGNFIDCVALHEREKHVVIVLIQRGVEKVLSAEEFMQKVLSEQRVLFLEEKGYGRVCLKAQSGTYILRKGMRESRSLTIIVRPFFSPKDVFFMQLAAERLLATGDNSAAESWSSRCKLYLYENLSYFGFKREFLEQQVGLALEFSPSLSRLLSLFGGLEGEVNTPFNAGQLKEAELLLTDPHLAEATLQFCDYILANYSFSGVLQGAIKRAVWHYVMPELSEVEIGAIGQEFYQRSVTYITGQDMADRGALSISSFKKIERHIQEAIEQRLFG